MPKNSLLDKMKMPLAKETKQKLDEYLNNNINIPMSNAGYPDTGAAISSALSTAGEMIIPDNLAEAALTFIPGGRLMKTGEKGMMKIVKPVGKALEEVAEADLKFGKIKAKDAMEKAIDKVEEVAGNTLDYSKMALPKAKAKVKEMADKAEEALDYSPWFGK